MELNMLFRRYCSANQSNGLSISSSLRFIITIQLFDELLLNFNQNFSKFWLEIQPKSVHSEKQVIFIKDSNILYVVLNCILKYSCIMSLLHVRIGHVHKEDRMNYFRHIHVYAFMCVCVCVSVRVRERYAIIKSIL